MLSKKYKLLKIAWASKSDIQTMKSKLNVLPQNSFGKSFRERMHNFFSKDKIFFLRDKNNLHPKIKKKLEPIMSGGSHFLGGYKGKIYDSKIKNYLVTNIAMPRSKNIIVDHGESIGKQKLKPTNIMMHEMGHALHDRKGMIGKERNQFRILKEERIANRNALNFIKNPKAREDYKQNMTPAYNTYKNVLKDDIMFEHSYKQSQKYKKLGKLFDKNYQNKYPLNTDAEAIGKSILRHNLKKTNNLKKFNINKFNEMSAPYKNVLDKKPWEI